MNRTTKQTRALGTFWAGPKVTDAEIEVLATADEYREQLCEIYQQRHESFIDLRNKMFPDLFAAMCRKESLSAKIWELETEIKKLHSDERNRNIVTDEQRERLEQLRKQRKEADADVKAGQKEWFALHKAVKEHWKIQADWINVKSLSKRRLLYAKIEWPEELREYGETWMRLDMLIRDLDEQFADKLHPHTRGEIKDASQPNTGKDKPGIRYAHGRKPECQPWTKMTVAFSGGLTVADALAGKNRQLSLRLLYTNHKASGDESTYEVKQQIGTIDRPHIVTHLAKFHRPLPSDAVIQRWSIVVRDNKTQRGQNRYVIPILTNCDFTKPTSKGSFTYKLSWTKRKEGIEVATFSGANVSESLIIPNWLVDKRMLVKSVQQSCDLMANELLANFGAAPQPKEKQGVVALEVYVAKYLENESAKTLLENCKHDLALALRRSQEAVRCIEKIYETVASRVCRNHDSICKSTLDLAKIKRYGTRDLLKEDVIPAASREIMFAVSPGKLKALLNGYGLESVEADEVETPKGSSDLFSSFVKNLGCKTGNKHSRQRNAERFVMQDVSAK